MEGDGCRRTADALRFFRRVKESGCRRTADALRFFCRGSGKCLQKGCQRSALLFQGRMKIDCRGTAHALRFFKGGREMVVKGLPVICDSLKCDGKWWQKGCRRPATLYRDSGKCFPKGCQRSVILSNDEGKWLLKDRQRSAIL